MMEVGTSHIFSVSRPSIFLYRSRTNGLRRDRTPRGITIYGVEH